MPQVKETLTYTFDELSEEAKERARDWWRGGALDYEWYDSVYDDAKTVAELMGIEIKNIWFRGFWSQGDGACFEGYYSYAKNSVAAVKAYTPQDEDLHKIAKNLADIQRRNFYQLSASVSHRGHYYHEFCTDIRVRKNDCDADADTEEGVKEFLRDFMCWIYRRLESEYEWLNANEQVDESIRCNDYAFLANGKLACA